jgi:tRNA1(Val) A37 N6-methylase TrmN6
LATNFPQPDAFLGGRLALRQPHGGHRAGTDAVLLGACMPPDARGRGIDVGAGAGAAGLVALLRAPALDMTFLEIDPDLAALCAGNLAENGLSARGRAICGDVSSGRTRQAAGLADNRFDIVLTNPPFYEAGAVRVSPDAGKARAHVVADGLEGWMKAALALLAPGGLFLMIHRADALPGILAGAAGRAGGLRLLPVLPRENEPATRLLVAGRKGSRAPLAILPPLVLHGPDGRFTARAEAIHRGEQGIDLAPH